MDSAEVSPMSARNSGESRPIDKLLINEYAAMVEMLPPKSPVIIGAEAAVGASTHIMAACAKVILNLKNRRYTSILPPY
jgi:hypothetical protein